MAAEKADAIKEDLTIPDQTESEDESEDDEQDSPRDTASKVRLRIKKSRNCGHIDSFAFICIYVYTCIFAYLHTCILANLHNCILAYLHTWS